MAVSTIMECSQRNAVVAIKTRGLETLPQTRSQPAAKANISPIAASPDSNSVGSQINKFISNLINLWHQASATPILLLGRTIGRSA
jgi:hypothetical protein